MMNLRRAERFEQSRAKRSRLRFVGAMEQVEADRRVGLVDRAADTEPCSPSLRPGRSARRNSARRATIWSATMSERFSSAVCSAATVAYSELTISMPASDPAVASSTTDAVAEIDELVARAERPPFLRRRAVAAKAERGDIVVERDVEPVGRRFAAGLAQAVDQLVAHQPARLAVDRRDADRAQRRRDRAAAPPP